MNNNIETLEVIDEQENIIGLEDRKKIHELGLLHKEVHVIFVTPQKEVIFQHREKTKTSMPDKLDATAGGHVDPGEGVLFAAVREAKEETGIEISNNELVFAGKIRSNIYEENTKVTNNVIRYCYGYLYAGKIEDLKIEQGNILGFVKYSLESLKNLSDEEKLKFIPERYEESYMDIYKKIFEKLESQIMI